MNFRIRRSKRRTSSRDARWLGSRTRATSSRSVRVRRSSLDADIPPIDIENQIRPDPGIGSSAQRDRADRYWVVWFPGGEVDLGSMTQDAKRAGRPLRRLSLG